MTSFNCGQGTDIIPFRELILSYIAIYENELIRKCIMLSTGFLFIIARFDVCATSRYVSCNVCRCTIQPLSSYALPMEILLLSANACLINVPSNEHTFILNILLSFVCRGFGFITFADPASVDKVLAQGNHELDGKKVSNHHILPD